MCPKKSGRNCQTNAVLLLVKAIKQIRIFQLAMKVIGDVVKCCKIIICMGKTSRKAVHYLIKWRSLRLLTDVR